LKVPAVCELLPLRDLPDGDNIMVRTNGAFVAGYELKGILSYFATDSDRNDSKAKLEALFRSVPDVSMRIQFRYEISERLGHLFENYLDQQRAEIAEVMALDAHRLGMWRQKEESGYYFEPRGMSTSSGTQESTPSCITRRSKTGGLAALRSARLS
jgi:hypothetical protein